MSKRAGSAVIGVLFILAPFFLATPVRDLRNWFNVESWKPVQAKVIAASERRARYARASSDRTELEVRVAFAYDGLPRESTAYVDPERKLSAGDVVTVRVNPRDPREALFNPKGDLLFDIITWWGAILFGVFALGYALIARPAQEE